MEITQQKKYTKKLLCCHGWRAFQTTENHIKISALYRINAVSWKVVIKWFVETVVMFFSHSSSYFSTKSLFPYHRRKKIKKNYLSFWKHLTKVLWFISTKWLYIWHMFGAELMIKVTCTWLLQGSRQQLTDLRCLFSWRYP